MKKVLTILFALIFCTGGAFAEDCVIRDNFQINVDSELMIGHEYYKGIKIKGIKIKQVEIKKDTYIKDGKIIEGEPNFIYIVVEITDMKGKKTILWGGKSLMLGDYRHIIEDSGE